MSSGGHYDNINTKTCQEHRGSLSHSVSTFNRLNIARSFCPFYQLPIHNYMSVIIVFPHFTAASQQPSPARISDQRGLPAETGAHIPTMASTVLPVAWPNIVLRQGQQGTCVRHNCLCAFLWLYDDSPFESALRNEGTLDCSRNPQSRIFFSFFFFACVCTQIEFETRIYVILHSPNINRISKMIIFSPCLTIQCSTISVR